MKVVILHDWLTGFRGGERVLEALCEMYPDAPIYTLIHKKGSTSKVIESKEIVTSFLDKIPGIYNNYRKFLPLMPLAVELMRIRHQADLVISSSHCVIKGLKKPVGATHISYIHSPMRYIYDQFDNYFKDASYFVRVAITLVRPFLIWWDKRSNRNVDEMIANSNFVKERIQNYYERSARVIHPFVELEDFQKEGVEKEEFYLMVSAFAPNKKVDLAIKSFNRLGKELKIIGSGSSEEVNRLKNLANDNIKFLGFASREEVIDHYYKTKGFIFPGVEDFGITPLEANAAGTAVIGHAVGGLIETQTDKTALLYKSSSVDGLVNAVKDFETKSMLKEELIENANRFSKEVFCEKISSFVNNVLDKN